MTRWERVVLAVQRHVANPIARRIARHLPGEAVLETIGRKSGLPRATPIGGRLDGSTFWLVTEFGRRAQYVRNIEADGRVRLQVAGAWRSGTASILDDDDARARLKQLPWLNSLLVRLVGTELLTVRVDLD
ncbi:nitroreductase/quinone reductase family protein [Jongsikchunia kroppenstedtii]|uniref:nitroreductase/quinone reductase family protein n=1 Tax=Jongsikchunia kroppenstedtii TaxID=1121721 RepID=UPI0003801C86|nr:nitroreductase/quinone reductase family protein [Jongsikchunia kroppenstedtii]